MSTPPREPPAALQRRPSEDEAFAAPVHVAPDAPGDHEPDRRDILTQHAFRIAPQLLGLPLASPTRRALAIGIDGVLVLMLAQAGGLLFALVAAVFVYSWLKSRARPEQTAASGKLRRSLGGSGRLLVALLVFSLGAGLAQPLWERYVADPDDDKPDDAASLDGVQGIGFAAATLGLSRCDDADCRDGAVEGLAALAHSAKGDQAQRRQLLRDAVGEAVKEPAERARLLALAEKRLDEAAPDGPAGKSADDEADADDDATAPAKQPAVEKAAEKHEKKAKPDEEERYSLLKQLWGLLDDLGLSFGWAAAYFTLFTTLWAGQTPGKRLLRIRVVHLSGRAISYWMSFSRYGGYAAGFVTGLLGFLQIYWDPNRQAVQDQLSFTAVIDDRAGTPPPQAPRGPIGA